MKSKLLFALIALVALISACGGSNANLYPNATGKPGEMLLIIDDNKWSSPVGDSIRGVFNRAVYGLPQPEPNFDIINISNKAFSRLFQTHRNIVRVRISPQITESYVKVKKDVWAKPQIYFEIHANHDSSFHKMFDQHKESILDSLLNSDVNNYIKGYKRFNAGETKNIFRKKGLDLAIPKGFTLKKQAKDFIWISHENTVLTQGLLAFFIDYTDTAQFQQKILIHQIDSVLKKNVPAGPNGKAYMQTEKYLGPQYTKYLTNNNFTVKLRGLWEAEGYPMGGSYVATAIPEVQRNRITVLLGFVFSPKLEKRNYQRQLEAIISSIKFVAIPIEEL